MVTIVIALFLEGINFSGAGLIITILIWISTVLTIISGLVYLKGYSKYIDTDK